KGENEIALTLTVADATPLRIYTTSQDEMDPVLTVLDEQGTELAYDDDTAYQSENTYDASVVLTVTPGQYTVRVHDYWGTDGAIEVIAEPVEVQELSLGETGFELTGDDVFQGALTVEPGTYTIDVASDADPQMTVVTPDGTESSDDRYGSDPSSDNDLDPYLEVTVSEEGMLLVMIAEYWGDDVSGTVTISQE